MAEEVLVIDDRSSGSLRSALGTSWRLVTDGVMGGCSRGRLAPALIADQPCLRLTGEVSLENHGGFIQAALDLAGTAAADASSYAGLLIDVCGNGDSYSLHLRTEDAWQPWQSYRVSFQAAGQWRTIRLPFADFSPHRIDKSLNLARLKRLGLVAIGRAFTADLSVAGIRLYRGSR